MIQDSRGFTLIELMVAIALSAVIIVVAYDVFISQQRAYSVQDQVVEMHQNARAAMYLMIREIRMAGYDPIKTGFDKIIMATEDSIHFRSDMNEDGDFNDPNDTDEDIMYCLNCPNFDLTLRRRTGNRGRQPLAENITDLTFEYNDENGLINYTDIDELNEQDRRDDIRRIRISITARTARPDPNWTVVDPNCPAGFRCRTLEARVKLRNLGID